MQARAVEQQAGVVVVGAGGVAEQQGTQQQEVFVHRSSKQAGKP
ncbi:hypothetical protein [Kingella potus]|nr:hypothetical protein [Kingella potus]